MDQIEKQLYFAYGSNMNLNQMAYRCPDAQVVGTVRLEGYRLTFCGNGGGMGVATILPDEGSYVEGVLWRISARDERNLDCYEGFPNLYGKEKVMVKGADGRSREVMAYAMNAPYRDHPAIPSRVYTGAMKMKKPFRHSAAMLCLVLLMGLTAPAVYAQGDGPGIPAKGIQPEISVEDITGWEGTPAQGFYPVSVEVTEENGLKLLKKTFVVDRDISPSSLIEPEIVRLGCAYAYLETLKEELPDSVESKAVTKTIAVTTDTDDLTAIAASQEAGLPYDEGGFSGELTLDEGKILVREGAKESYSYAVTDTRTYSGLAAQDPYLVPKEVSKNGVTLALADIQWTPAILAGAGGQKPLITRLPSPISGRCARQPPEKSGIPWFTGKPSRIR